MVQTVHVGVSDTSKPRLPHHPDVQIILCNLLQSAEWSHADPHQNKSDPEYASDRNLASADSHHYDRNYGSAHHEQNSMGSPDMVYYNFVPQSFTLDDNGNESLAQLGFIVINVGFRGSCFTRGRNYHCFGYGNLRDYALADCKFVIEQLANRYPFIDLDRVGIYGHSGGGFMAAASILTYPDFYKVAVAASGNHDNNIYTKWWGETYHGVKMHEKKVEKRDSVVYSFESKIPTTIELAKNLKGKLLLITGDMDINVHMAHTIRLANALMQANKRFDLMLIPGADHGLGSPYYVNLIRYYFVENLFDET